MIRRGARTPISSFTKEYGEEEAMKRTAQPDFELITTAEMQEEELEETKETESK